jgi:hypothetical protein
VLKYRLVNFPSILPTLLAIAAVGFVGLQLILVIRRLAQKMNPAPVEPATPAPAVESSGDSARAQYLNLVISEKGVAEFEGDRRIIFVPKRDVQSIEIRFGAQAERPLLQGIAGIVLISIGIGGLFIVEYGGFANLRWGLGELVFGGLGVWLLWEAFKRGHFLRVDCARETRKFPLKGSINEAGLLQFTREAAQLGYVIRDCRDRST